MLKNKNELENMTREQLQYYRKSYSNWLSAIDERLNQIESTLTLKDNSLPFRKWSMSEKNELLKISQKAFNWFVGDNNDKTIFDYNEQAAQADRITLEK